MLTFKTQIAFATPYFSDHFDCLFQGSERVARSATRSAVRLDGIPESSGAKP